MKRHFSLSLSALLFAVIFSACSSDEDATETAQNQITNAKAIAFTTLSDMSKETRATATTPDNATTQVTDFDVWAYNPGTSTYYMGATGGNGIVLNRNTTDATKWDYKNEADTHYWPSFALDFYALTPATNANYKFDGDNLSYTVPENNGSQVDVMTAQNANVSENSNNGTVALNFSHILSQIAFKAKTRYNDMQVEIKGITIHNVGNTYNYNLKTATGSAATDSDSNYAVGLANPVTASSTTESVSATDDNGVLLLAPQTLTAWTDGTETTAADEAHQTYLSIDCKIKEGDNYLIGSADTYGTTYVPFSATWAAGNKYIYTLVFGVGKDSHGGSSTVPITFTVSVSDWTDGTTSDMIL